MEDKGLSSLLVIYGLVLFIHSDIVHGDLSYSIPEELKRGSVIGNIAKDLGLGAGRLSSRKARVDAEGNRKMYCDINLAPSQLAFPLAVFTILLC